MINNLTVTAKSVTWITTQLIYKGRRTAHLSGFFMSARLYLPVMVGLAGPSPDGPVYLVAGCGNPVDPATIFSKLPLRLGGSKKYTRSSIMAQLRLLVDDRLSVYAKRVRNTIKTNLPVFGDSPRILLDPNEISSLSSISVDKAVRGIKELEREGYLARMFKGRRTKAHVYALLNPDLKGTAMEVWG